MGSFTQVALSFDFRTDTPPEVLAAFSALASPELREGTPQLPPPNVEPWELFEPDWRERDPYWRERGHAEGQGDPFMDRPWVHDWAEWVSTTMGGTTTPHGILAWSGRRWHLDCRFDWKTWPEAAQEALSWLAPFIKVTAGHPELVGYASFSQAPRPLLFWVVDGRWEMEDLNPNGDWMMQA